jgi:hypothetical protein
VVTTILDDGGDAIPFAGDVAVEENARACVDAAIAKYGVNGQPRNTGYGGTKAFLHAFMAGVAVEQAQYGVRANCVCPGPIETPWTHKETGAVDADIEKALITATPLGRRGTPEEANAPDTVLEERLDTGEHQAEVLR